MIYTSNIVLYNNNELKHMIVKTLDKPKTKLLINHQVQIHMTLDNPIVMTISWTR